MNSGKQHMDEKLLIRYIIGEVNDGESVMVQEWISQSDDNRSLFEKLQKIWSATEDPQKVTPADVNTTLAWEKLKDRIDQYHEIQNKYQGKQRSLSYYLVRVAAVFVICFFIYGLYKYQNTQQNQVQIASADTTLTNNPLPDGSIISLNENTKIEYPKEFSKKERRIKMSGEAFFDVEPDAARPFIIEAQDAVITVLGTSFNVKALQEDVAVEVLVEEGIVELANPDKSQFTELRIGEKGIYLKETKEVKKETDIDAESLYWLNKTLLFRDTNLSIVFETLERLYDVKIEVDNEKIYKCQLTAKFSNETIDNIIDHISTIFELKSEKNANNILIKGNGCQ